MIGALTVSHAMTAWLTKGSSMFLRVMLRDAQSAVGKPSLVIANMKIMK